MRHKASDIDRLIEEGLSRYGAGDVDGALDVWEAALRLDPNNAQANSYVEYVKSNYDVLTGIPDGDDATQDYGFSDEPDYQIEVSGYLAPGEPAPMYMDPKDEGWFLKSEAGKGGEQPSHEALTLELDADEPEMSIEADEPETSFDGPPGSLELEADEPADYEGQTSEYPPGGPVDFETPTKEFESQRGKPDPDLTPGFLAENTPTPGFGPEATPVGFSTQTTDVRKRDFGFVQAVTSRSEGELKVTVRTPDPNAPQPRVPTPKPSELIDMLPSPRPVTNPPPATPTTTRDLPDERRPPASQSKPPPTQSSSGIPASPAVGRPTGQLRSPAIEAAKLGAADTIKPGRSPSRPPPIVEKTRERTPTGEPESRDIARSPTRPSVPPPPPVPPPLPPTELAPDPATLRKQDEISIGVAPTRELQGALPQNAVTSTTQKLPPLPDQASVNAMITSTTQKLPPLPTGPPTRDLGLRAERRPSSGHDEEEPTRESATVKKREAGTQHDLGVVSFDPIDARSNQILQEVDADAPPNESKDDQTKRRISSLLDRALAWNGISEFDKAVAAVDLALSENPDTAAAQKLIHRHQNTIMSVFQNYLGDLQRIPALAKPLHELSSAPISPRAAFLMSRIDGSISIDELLDVSGMPRMEAYRYLCQLFLRGILR